MPYITSVERLAMERGEAMGLRRGLGTAVKLKFGAAGVDLLPAIESIQDLGKLRALEDAIPSTATADEFRKLMADAPSTD
jgi:hypothetical protein